MADLRKPGRYLVPISFDKSPTTGYFTWHCRVEEVDENGSVQHGPVELHGTDIQALKQNYGGDHERFLLESVKPQMMQSYDEWSHDHSKAPTLVNKSL